MGGYIEYEGKTFGKLKVIGRTGFTSRSAGTELLVRNIGTHKVKTITSGNLRHGHRGDKKFPQSLCSRNATGYAGVTINAGRYFSQIGIDGINYGIGHFNNGEEEHQAYEDAKSNYLKHMTTGRINQVAFINHGKPWSCSRKHMERGNRRRLDRHLLSGDKRA